MGDKKPFLFFIERLTFPIWISCVFPHILFLRLKNDFLTREVIYYIDATPSGLFFARVMGWLINLEIRLLSFRLVDIRDELGMLIRLRIAGEDLIEIQNDILNRPEFKSLLESIAVDNPFLNIYLKKQAVSFTWDSAGTVWRMIFLVHVARWAEKKVFGKGAEKIFFADKRLWRKELISYAAKYDVKVIFSYFHRVNIKNFVASLVGEHRLRACYYIYLLFGIEGLLFRYSRVKKDRFIPICFEAKPGPKVMVEYYGHLNLDRPEFFSDLFFLQNSQLHGRDIIVSFNVPASPLDFDGLDELKKHKISVVVLNPKASRVKDVPVFIYMDNSHRYKKYDGYTKYGSDSRWLCKQITSFYRDVGYWRELFLKTNTRLFVSWFNGGARHCVISEALRQIGGVSVIYQRSFEEFPSPELTLGCDVAFGFSKISVDAQIASGCYVNYYVITGYLGDFRFKEGKRIADKLRQQLLKNGAKRILAFFDENSMSDSRWHTGHEFMRHNYAFLLQKVIDDDGFGLILKPKVPRTLRERLGEVADLFDKAIATGRCYMFSGGTIHGVYPPSVAALASDIAVHGHLCSGSAGVESALTGTPTLLLDREGWPRGILNRLGKGKVIFHDWVSLWEACQQHWKQPGSISGFGDWSELIDELDPFRDGKAAERMGTYLFWIIESLKKGLPKDKVLADAAECYSDKWGKDKIFELTSID